MVGLGRKKSKENKMVVFLLYLRRWINPFACSLEVQSKEKASRGPGAEGPCQLCSNNNNNNNNNNKPLFHLEIAKEMLIFPRK